MQLVMSIWGYINGKISVKCAECKHLKKDKCFGRIIPEEMREKPRMCGFWKKRFTWRKRY